MKTHAYLEHGTTILRAHLSGPSNQIRVPRDTETEPFVTLSREACAGATTLGRELVSLLDAEFPAEGRSWFLLDKNLLEHALTKHLHPERLAEFLPEDRISEIQALIGELLGLHPPLVNLEHEVEEAIHEIARSGRVIFVGRGANFITRSLKGGYHVRLVAPESVRVKRMMAAMSCNEETALAEIRRSHAARKRYVRSNFDEDIDDPLSYDMVLNTQLMDAPAAARLVMAGLREKMRYLQVQTV